MRFITPKKEQQKLARKVLKRPENQTRTQHKHAVWRDNPWNGMEPSPNPASHEPILTEQQQLERANVRSKVSMKASRAVSHANGPPWLIVLIV